MKKNHIIIFRADGPLKNTYLTDKLEKLNYKIKSYPILSVKKIHCLGGAMQQVTLRHV